MTRLRIATVITGLTLCLMQGIAQGDEPIEQPWRISLGVFATQQDVDTRFAVVGQGLVGDFIDFEEALGLRPNEFIARLDGHYRFRERQRLDFSVFDLSRDADISLEQEIEWNDSVFPVSAAVNTDLGLTVYRAAYVYDLMRNDQGDFGVSLGLHIADVDLSIAASGLGLREDEAVTAPLPVIGLRGNYYFGERWRLQGRYEYFLLEVDDIGGQLNDAIVSLSYRFTDHFSFGLGYNLVDLEIDAVEERLKGFLDWQYSGVVVFLEADF